MGMGFDPTWLRQVSPLPLLHKTTLTTDRYLHIIYCDAVYVYRSVTVGVDAAH